MLMKLATALVCTAILAGAAFAEKAPLPGKGKGSADSTDHVAAVVECLTDTAKGPGLTEGTIEEVRKGEAHFAIVEKKAKIGATQRLIGFFPGLRNGDVDGVNTDKVDACMEQFGPR